MSRSVKSYSRAEKSRLVGEVQRRYRQGDATYKAIANALGIPKSNYFSWVRVGIRSDQAIPGRRTTAAPYEPAVRDGLILSLIHI